MMKENNQAVFWIVSGRKYVLEAIKSAASIRKHMPFLKRYLFVLEDAPKDESEFNHVVKIPTREFRYWPLAAMEYLVQIVFPTLDKYDGLLWLDSDTFACCEFGELLEMLKRFDFVGAHAPGRQTRKPLTNVPAAFPEFNIGMLAFRNNLAIQQMFRQCLQRYQENADHYGFNDQTALRDTLWLDGGNLRLATVTPEFNCRYGFGVFVRGPVRICHGRQGNQEAICQSINKHWGMRLWTLGEIE